LPQSQKSEEIENVVPIIVKSLESSLIELILPESVKETAFIAVHEEVIPTQPASEAKSPQEMSLRPDGTSNVTLILQNPATEPASQSISIESLFNSPSISTNSTEASEKPVKTSVILGPPIAHAPVKGGSLKDRAAARPWGRSNASRSAWNKGAAQPQQQTPRISITPPLVNTPPQSSSKKSTAAPLRKGYQQSEKPFNKVPRLIITAAGQPLTQGHDIGTTSALSYFNLWPLENLHWIRSQAIHAVSLKLDAQLGERFGAIAFPVSDEFAGLAFDGLIKWLAAMEGSYVWNRTVAVSIVGAGFHALGYLQTAVVFTIRFPDDDDHGAYQYREYFLVFYS